MRRQIRAEIYKIFVVLGMLLGLVAWQYDFVWTGIVSNVYLNMTIIGMFFFGIFLAFRIVFSLGNEVNAFGCLKEAYEDIRFHQSRAEQDPFWRHYRCLEPATVFVKPKLLGHVFALTYEKVLRTGDLRINIATMQSLVSELKGKLADDRSLFQYVTGLLVFLGLIGTFIGLMNMVGSVGGIIGGLAEMDPSEGGALMKLINDLKEPLVGMATGFSSSLFGLFGSLVLGLIGRFLNIATGVLKGEFESWLAELAELEAEDDDGITEKDIMTLMSHDMRRVGLALERNNQFLQNLDANMRQTAALQSAQVNLFQQMNGFLKTVAVQPDRNASPVIEQQISRLDQQLADGFSTLNQTFESAFTSYAQLLKNVTERDRPGKMGQSLPQQALSENKGTAS
jgi:hypothetical protein